MKKVLLSILAILAVVIIGFVIFVLSSWDKNFEAPLPDITASKDSALIERGRHLIYGPAHCGTCHIPLDNIPVSDQTGQEFPLQGGWELNIPPGSFRAPNLTPDMETGIGKISDGQIARALRYSVNHNNKMMFPFMPFQELSDMDVKAVISFLRSQPAVKSEVKPKEYSFLGKALVALGALTPEGPKNTPPKSVEIDSTIAYGDYLANRVANCVGCHTNRDLKTGKRIGEPFAGGLHFEPDPLSLNYSFITPNLTPDKETGVIANWTEQAFINRFKAGRVHKGSHMPWGAFKKMDDLELKALYRYLRTVKPVNNKIAQTVFVPGEKFPEN